MSIHQKKIEKYLKSKGVRCLVCGSEDIEGNFISVEEGVASQEITCCDCGATWTDNYKLESITDLDLSGARLEYQRGEQCKCKFTRNSSAWASVQLSRSERTSSGVQIRVSFETD